MNKNEIENSNKLPNLKKIELRQSNFVDKHSEKMLEFTKNIRNPLANAPEQKKLIILIDIVGFSKSSTRQQVYNIYQFQHYLMIKVLTSKFKFSQNIKINQFIPTGDGCYIVADECSPENALNFLTTLIGGIGTIQDSDENPMKLRVSALLGDCVQFLDIAKHINFVGEGMNEASRILSGGQKTLEDLFIKNHNDCDVLDAKKFSQNSLYLGDSLCENLNDFKNNCDEIFYLKNVADKHGKTRNVTVLQNIKV